MEISAIATSMISGMDRYGSRVFVVFKVEKLTIFGLLPGFKFVVRLGFGVFYGTGFPYFHSARKIYIPKFFNATVLL